MEDFFFHEARTVRNLYLKFHIFYWISLHILYIIINLSNTSKILNIKIYLCNKYK